MTIKSALLILTLLFSLNSWAKGGHVLKFEGVPLNLGQEIKQRFPFVFEREVTLSEVDDVVRYLMGTGDFANIEVVERPGHADELLLIANIVRTISEIRVRGNHLFSNNEVLRTLIIQKGQIFERKNLVTASEELRDAYAKAGYLNAKLEIDFDLPSEKEVRVNVTITENPVCQISDIIIDTGNRDLALRLRRISRAYFHNAISEENIINFQKAANEYLQQNRYLTAKLSSPAIAYNGDRTQAKLTYVVEHPFRYEFIIDGAVYYTEGTIIKELELDKIASGSSSPISDLAERVRKFYQSHGFANVQVDSKEKVIESVFKHQIRFKITEGPRVRIRRLDVIGNISRAPKYYADLIVEHSSDLTAAGLYSHKDLESGYKNLIIELQNQGYLHAKIQAVRTEFLKKDKSAAVISVSLDEGPLTQIKQIGFEGNISFTKAQLSDVVKMKSNSPLSLTELQESIQRLKDFYHNQGYLEMRLLNEEDGLITYNEANTQASIEFQIQEGPKIIVASINLVGNSFTKDYVILREITIHPGDVLTTDKIESSISNLQKVGLFSSVQIKSEDENSSIANRQINVIVAERDPGLFSSGLGLTNEYQFTTRGYFGVSYRNLGGTARALSGRVDLKYSLDPDISYLENKITIGYLEPYLFESLTRGRLSLVREQKYDPTTGSDAQILENNALTVQTERDLSRHLRLTYTVWNFNNERTFRRYTNTTVETLNVGKTGPLLTWDYRDNIFNPTRGSYSFISLNYSDPNLGSSDDRSNNVHFAKTEVSTSHYTKVGGSSRVIWSNQLAGGYLTNLTSWPGSGGSWPGSGVPAIEAFFMGGQSTIRGFEPTSLERIPNTYQLGVRDYKLFHVQYDSWKFLIKSEMKFLLWGSAGIALFYDGGAVFINGHQFDPSQRTQQRPVLLEDAYRHSAGIGFRYDLPIGPVSIDLAFKLNPRTWYEGAVAYPESKYTLTFSIGTF